MVAEAFMLSCLIHFLFGILTGSTSDENASSSGSHMICILDRNSSFYFLFSTACRAGVIHGSF